MILALASVVAAIAAVVTLVTLVVTGGNEGSAPSPQNQVVAPGPNGSDQHLYNRAREHAQGHAPYSNRSNPGLGDFM
jgi:hypothetical protein